MQNRSADSSASTVAVVGLGKIGLPLAIQFAQHGRRVIGCDIDPAVVDTINTGQAHVQEESELAVAVASAVASGTLSATLVTSEAVCQAAVVVVIIPVAIDVQREIDFQALDAATIAIGEGLRPGTLIIYETTLPVGTTSSRLRHLLERASHLQAGRDFYLAYSPERVSSGSIFRDLRAYPKIVGGIDEQSMVAAVEFYRSVLDADILLMASTDEAEFVKLIETTYRDVNIALANEYARFADARGLDVAAAISAANTQPYSHIHSPGVGVGGHCIPVYPYFLLAGVEEPSTHELTLPRSARRVNDAMAEHAVCRVEEMLGTLVCQSVLILGVAYRGDVHEAAFTSAQLLQDALREHGATVYVDDPLFSASELHALGYTPCAPEHESEIGAIIVQAGHRAYQEYDFARFSNCRVVLDGRRALDRERVEACGIRYVAIGDGRSAHTQRANAKEAPVPVERGGQHACD
ncbi:MAG TPA: nucleotide sugar dehydrogenase [Ktedonobacteraceae bacterium]|nr:nucleotide sugar dehydrogenase [Ktedonobacteraceae bacterium]